MEGFQPLIVLKPLPAAWEQAQLTMASVILRLLWNPEGDMGDMEIWELLLEPLVYMGREILPGSGGAGKYRGGNGWQSLRLGWGARRMDNVRCWLLV